MTAIFPGKLTYTKTQEATKNVSIAVVNGVSRNNCIVLSGAVIFLGNKISYRWTAVRETPSIRALQVRRSWSSANRRGSRRACIPYYIVPYSRGSVRTCVREQ